MAPTPDGTHRHINDWKEYKNLVIDKLEILQNNIGALDEKIDNLQIQNAIMTHTLSNLNKMAEKVEELEKLKNIAHGKALGFGAIGGIVSTIMYVVGGIIWKLF